MGLTKWKIAALALLPTGILASGAIAIAQDRAPDNVPTTPDQPSVTTPAPETVAKTSFNPFLTTHAASNPGAGPSDPDRLRAVELKLDRVLEALERAAVPRAVFPTDPAGDLVSHPQNRYGANQAVGKTSSRPAGPPGETLPVGARYAAADRDNLAQRVAELERRLAELEHRLGSSAPSSASADSAKRP
jgi:hypothetical protein